MIKKIKVAVSKTEIESKMFSIDLPEVAKYYIGNDDSNFFGRGTILLAIIPKFESNPTNTYTLVQIESNKQDCTDFVPHDDCSSEYWLKAIGIRKVAFNILTRNTDGFVETNETDFNKTRNELLNQYLTN